MTEDQKERARQATRPLDVGAFGLSARAVQRLEQQGIMTFGDLESRSQAEIRSILGTRSPYFKDVCQMMSWQHLSFQGSSI